MKRAVRKIQMQEEAVSRQETYDKLTATQKIKKLDKKLGKGIGAKKQRAKLNKELETDK
jgi:hypothetical protein